MEFAQIWSIGHSRKLLPGAVGVVAAGWCLGASAIGIDVGNDDFVIRFDNSVRYTLGVRTQGINPAAANTSTLDDSDTKFGKGHLVANRVDLLSEFDVVYKTRFGGRVSGAGWYDNAYRNSNVSGSANFNTPVGNISSAYPDETYSSFAKRWNRGVSGEVLDAFVFGGFDIGSVPVDAKVGRHNVYWGESLFSFVHGVSYSQGPVDLRKAFANPGAQAKELFLPLNQISTQAQLTSTLSVAGQYYFDWEGARFPDGGTYFGIQDFLTDGGGAYVVNPALAQLTGFAPAQFIGTPNKPKGRGDWGVKASWRPQLLDGTLGFYYREYTDKLPQIVSGGFQTSPAGVAPTDVRFTFAEGVRLFGVSLSKDIGGVSVGSELTFRRNTGLLMSPATMAGFEPRGNTLHFLVNAVATIPRNPVFDFGSVLAELTYSRLQGIRANASSYNGVGYGCSTGDMLDGCSTKDAWGIAVKFEPVWYQALSGVDLSMPVFVNVGLKGNSPVLFGGYKGNGSYSIGGTADILSKYNVALSYNGYLVKYKTAPDQAGQQAISTTNGIGYFGDRGWVSLTFKTSF